MLISTARVFCMPNICPAKFRLGHEFVTGSLNSSKMNWSGRIFFKFLAQFQNVVVHGAGAWVVLVSPHFVQQLIAGNDAFGILYEEFQGLEFLCGEPYLFASAGYFHFGEINAYIGEARNFVFG